MRTLTGVALVAVSLLTLSSCRLLRAPDPMGEPISAAESARRASAARDSTPWLVRGWLVETYHTCIPRTEPPVPDPVLAPYCGSWYAISDDPEYDGTEPKLHFLDVRPPNVSEFPALVVLRVHAHDPRATECPLDIRAECERQLVVEAGEAVSN